MKTQIAKYLSRKINHYRFKILNRRLSQNQIAISNETIVNVHKDAYFAFRYFTDFDEDMVKEMKCFIRLTKGKKCFLDIGAHYGIFSLVFSSNSNTLALAVDPSPSAYKILEHHRDINPKCHIESFQLAIGDSEGKLKMQPDGCDHFVVTKSDSWVSDKLVEVDVTTIDSFVALKNTMPDVIKIDTEGFELNVLRGGMKFFEDYNPMIFLEVHPDFLRQLGYSVEELIAILSQLSYKLYDSDFKLIQNPLSYLDQDIRRIICCR